MLQQLRTSVILLAVLTVLLGIVYPGIITGISQIAFPHQANGSILETEQGALGSELVGQQFTEANYFWGRLSATSPRAYNGAASSGSNWGPSNPRLRAVAEARIAELHKFDVPQSQVPVELVTASASGLDPHISPAAAEYQVTRVATARGIPEDKVRELIQQHTDGRQFGILGEPRVHVLRLNLALDHLSQDN
jgi:K+-transporting ATPase ATPase C chain